MCVCVCVCVCAHACPYPQPDVVHGLSGLEPVPSAHL